MKMPLLLRILLFHAFALIGTAAAAQITTIPVRAGEHMDFTRLVIRIPNDNGWRVTTEGRTARLIVDGPELRFDLSQTFSRIPRTRLGAVRTTSDGLIFELACDCELRASEDISQYLVIDILGVANPAEVARPLSGLRPQPRPENMLPRPGTRSPELDRAGRELARRLRGNSDQPRDSRTFPLHPALAPPAAKEETDRYMDLQTARDAIARELGRALSNSVSLGTLQPAEDFGSRPEISDRIGTGSPGIDGTLDAHFALPGESAQAASAPERETCRLLALLDVQSDSQTLNRLHGLPVLAPIFSEFDQLDHSRMVEVIRHYLSIGFGAEARLGASLLDPDDPLRRIIFPISHAVDLEPVARESAPENLASCSPSGLLWSFLLNETYPVGSDATLNMLVQATEGLPTLLRLHLGPTIVQRLVSQGHVSAAQRIEASISRVTQTDTPELTLASVTVALAGSTTGQDEILEASLSPELSDEALVFLLSRRDQQGETAEVELIDLAENRLLALRRDPLGSEIARLLARAFARNAAFEEAFALADSRHNGLTTAATRDLRHWLFDKLAQTPDDTIFVVNIFAQRPWMVPELPEDLRASLASRLERLGFAEQAGLLREDQMSFLGPIPEQMLSDNQQMRASERSGEEEHNAFDISNSADIVRARIAQAELRSERTLPDRLPDPSDNLLTAQEEDAATASPSENQPEPAALVADARLASDPEQWSRNEPTRPEPEPGLLSQARTALDQSEDFRARLQAMLAQPVSGEDRNID
ncbi:MAG: hypothetical protein JJU24_04915 [Natronohydrobacter sp.]|nr:hypothetical protein [Natronohydrobacter sp.]